MSTGGPGPSGTQTASSTGAPGSTGPTGPTGSTDTSTTGGDAESTTEGSGSSSTGGEGFVLLQNDMWRDGAQTSVQGGFTAGECWASTFVAEASLYPFRVRGLQVLISGDVEGESEAFEVGVWSVDDELRPQTQIGSALAEFTASNEGFNGAEFDLLAIDDIVLDEGNFAISMCLSEHDGFPAIATDVRQELLVDRNWLFSAGTWSPSSEFGLTGNWILRAVLEPQ